MPAFRPAALLLAALARLPAALGSSAWVPADGPQVDAVLFRTHFVDALIVKKLTELVRSSAVPLGSPPAPSSAVAVAADGRLDPASTSRPPVGFEVTVLFDSEAAPDFGHRLQQAGFNYSAHGVQLLGLALRDFTHYPNVKPVGANCSVASLNGNYATTRVGNFSFFSITHTHICLLRKTHPAGASGQEPQPAPGVHDVVVQAPAPAELAVRVVPGARRGGHRRRLAKRLRRAPGPTPRSAGLRQLAHRMVPPRRQGAVGVVARGGGGAGNQGFCSG